MNNKTLNPKGKSTAQSRRTWSFFEEQQLIHALKDLVVKGYKSDNGFRTGYLNLLEHDLAQKFPGTDLKAEPHIASKIHSWKKNYNTLTTMFSKSGFGMGANHIIDVADDVWDAYVKSDPHVRTMRFKTWPFYEDWVEIFGKDRATGQNATGFADAIQDFLNTGNTDPTDPLKDSDKAPHSVNDGESSVFMSKNGEGSSNTSKRTGQPKYRKVVPPATDPLYDTLGYYCEKNDMKMDEIRSDFRTYAMKKVSKVCPSEKRERVYDVLDTFEFPSLKSRVDVGRFLATNDSELDYFLSVPDEARMILIKDIAASFGHVGF